MIIGPHPRGYFVVLQRDHATMTAQLARAWGSPAVGGPADEVVVVAAAEHERGWDGRDLPILDPAAGVPCGPGDIPLAAHLPMQLDGPRELGESDPHAGLLVAIKHCNRYRPVAPQALLLRRHRQVARFRRDSARLQRDLRARIAAPDSEIDRQWRTLHACDTISHAQLTAVPRLVGAVVPGADGRPVTLTSAAAVGGLAIDPWPFSGAEVRLDVPGRVLAGGCTSQAELERAFTAAPVEMQEFLLVPAQRRSA